MTKKFVVSASKASLSRTSLQGLAVTVPVLSAVIATQSFEDQRLLVLLSVAGLVVLVGIFLQCGKSEELEAIVSVNDLSVQFSTHRNEKLVGYPVLISRQEILDIVVNEVILSHKVVSVLVFRVLKLGMVGKEVMDAAKVQPMHSLLKENKVRLQVAFPGVEMSYMECMIMRREISQTLSQS